MKHLILKLAPMFLNYITRNRFMMVSLSAFGGQNIYQDKDFEDAEYNQVCSEQMDKAMNRFISKMSVLYLSLITCMVWPIYAYITDGIKTTTTDLRIPFTELGSNTELIVNLIIQFIIGIHSGITMVSMESFLSLVENVVLTSPQIFKVEMNRLCKQYKSKSISEFQMRTWFRNLVELSNDADE